MRAMTEIEWLDGRVTKVPELALGDAFGESAQRSSISGSTMCWRAFGSWCAIMSRMRTRTATRAGGAAHCTRTAGTAWSNRRTSTVTSHVAIASPINAGPGLYWYTSYCAYSTSQNVCRQTLGNIPLPMPLQHPTHFRNLENIEPATEYIRPIDVAK